MTAENLAILESKTRTICVLENLLNDTEIKIKELKSQCEEIMKNESTTNYSDSNYHIVWREGTSTESLNVKKLQEVDNVLYEKLFQDYGKVSQRKGSFAWTKEKSAI